MIIAIDFDGTCVTKTFPGIGKDIGAVSVLKKLIEKEHKLILWTLRCDHDEDFNEFIVAGQHLTDALEWFKSHDIELYGIKQNPNDKPYPGAVKPYYHILIDDSSLGCPLTTNEDLSDKPFVDWTEVEKLLIQQGIL